MAPAHPRACNAPEAWDWRGARGGAGGRGAVVAVIDTGVAFENRGSFRRAPDLGRRSFVRGYDFFGDDGHPNDENGHGTHVAARSRQATGNGRLGAGIAYRARIMPMRVLEPAGRGRRRRDRARGPFRAAQARRRDQPQRRVRRDAARRHPRGAAALDPLARAPQGHHDRRGGGNSVTTAHRGHRAALPGARAAGDRRRRDDLQRLPGRLLERRPRARHRRARRRRGRRARQDNPIDRPNCRPDAASGRDILQQTFWCDPLTSGRGVVPPLRLRRGDFRHLDGERRRWRAALLIASRAAGRATRARPGSSGDSSDARATSGRRLRRALRGRGCSTPGPRSPDPGRLRSG